jgi:hypothetical protein
MLNRLVWQIRFIRNYCHLRWSGCSPAAAWYLASRLAP